MIRFFTMLGCCLTMVTFCTACSDSDDSVKTPPPLHYELTFSEIAVASYLGDGCYLIELADTDGDRVRLQLSDECPEYPSAAQPAAGDYPVAIAGDKGTCLAAESWWEVLSLDENGTSTTIRYTFAQGTVSLFRDTTIASLNGRVADTSGNSVQFTWTGELCFVNDSQEEDPIIPEVLTVYGDYYANFVADTDVYMLTGYNSTVYFKSQIATPCAAGGADPQPAVGEYFPDVKGENGYGNVHYSFRPGEWTDASQSRAKGTYWTDVEGVVHLADAGSFTVSGSGEEWHIEGTLRESATGERFAFVYTGAPNFR